AGDHPRVDRRFDDRERTAERTEDRDRIARTRVVQETRRRPDAFAQNAEARRGARLIAEDLEHRKRTTQERGESRKGLYHHDLPGRGGGGNGGRREREDVVVGGERSVRDDRRRDVDGHSGQYTWSVRGVFALFLLLTLRSADIERAVSLARWPTTDAG